jgi:hypothetical protein
LRPSLSRLGCSEPARLRHQHPAEPKFQRRAAAPRRLPHGERYAAPRTNLDRAIRQSLLARPRHTLDDWATRQTGAPIKRCGTCQPPAPRSGVDGSPLTVRAVKLHRPPQARRGSQNPITTPGAACHHWWEIRGPSSTNPVLVAWIDDYVRFERRPPHQEQLRVAIRERLRALDARRASRPAPTAPRFALVGGPAVRRHVRADLDGNAN